MRFTKCICDRCKKPIIDRSYTFMVAAIDAVTGEYEEECTLLDGFGEKDLCRECLKELDDMLCRKLSCKVSKDKAPETDKDAGISEPEAANKDGSDKADETKADKSETDRPKKKRKVDAGKILALYKAGWSARAIGEELGCCDQTVYNIINESGEKACKESKMKETK